MSRPINCFMEYACDGAQVEIRPDHGSYGCYINGGYEANFVTYAEAEQWCKNWLAYAQLEQDLAVAEAMGEI